MLPVFTSLQIHREALAALSFLRQAIEAEQASVGLVAAVGECQAVLFAGSGGRLSLTNSSGSLPANQRRYSLKPNRE